MNAKAGWIYIASNNALPGVIKIGKSSRNPKQQRIPELSSSTSIPEPFRCEYQAYVRSFDQAEINIHDHFVQTRVNKRREFFRLSVHDCVISIRNHCRILREESFYETPQEKYRQNLELVKNQYPLKLECEKELDLWLRSYETRLDIYEHRNWKDYFCVLFCPFLSCLPSVFLGGFLDSYELFIICWGFLTIWFIQMCWVKVHPDESTSYTRRFIIEDFIDNRSYFNRKKLDFPSLSDHPYYKILSNRQIGIKTTTNGLSIWKKIGLIGLPI